MASKLIRTVTHAVSSRWAFCRSLLSRLRPTGWVAATVGILTVALAALSYYRDEWPESPQPPFLSDILTFLPWWAWLLVALASTTMLLFEVTYREVTRLKAIAFPKPALPAVEKGLLDFQVDLENSATGFPREMKALTKRVQDVNQKVIKRNAEWIKHAGDARKQRRVASRLASDFTEFAERVDEQLLTTAEQGRLMTGSILGVLKHKFSPLAPADPEDLLEIRESQNVLLKSTKGGRAGVLEFRKALLKKRRENWSRDLNEALEERVVPSLDRIIDTIKTVERTTAQTIRVIDERRRASKKSTRRKAGRQPPPVS